MDKYLIWSNEHRAWWLGGGCGYTKSMTKAGVYDHQTALGICAAAVPGTADDLGALPEMPVRREDARTIRADYRSQFPHAGRGIWE